MKRLLFAIVTGFAVGYCYWYWHKFLSFEDIDILGDCPDLPEDYER